MVTIVYDTNMVIALLSPTDALHQANRIARQWETQAVKTVMSVVTWAELRTGALRRGAEAERSLTKFYGAAIDEVVPVLSRLLLRRP